MEETRRWRGGANDDGRMEGGCERVETGLGAPAARHEPHVLLCSV